MTIGRVLQGFLFGCLMVAFSHRTSAHEDSSPVQVFDAPKWIRLSERAKASPHVTSLKGLIEIIYDRIIRRPWPEAEYWQEATDRWSVFRATYCSAKELSLCQLPETVENMDQLAAIRNGLVSEQSRQILNAHLAKVDLRLSPNLIFPVQVRVAESEKQNFSFRISTIEADEHSNVDGKRLVTMGDEILQDILTYRVRFEHEIARTYFAIDSAGNGYVQSARLREVASTLGPQWKAAAEQDVGYTTIDVGDLHLRGLRKELAQEFSATYDRLLAKMDSQNPHHKEHIKRFQVERSRDRYPTEVYQWVIYDQLLQMTVTLTEHYQLAKLNHENLHTLAQSLKAVMALQSQTSPRLIYYLLHRVWDFDEGAVLEQILNKPGVELYMVEHLQVLLGETYDEVGGFAKYAPRIDYSLLTDPEFLRAHHPGLGTPTAEQLRALPPEAQRAWLEAYVTRDGEPFPIGVYSLSAALTLSLDARSARDIANTIRQMRLADPET